MIDLFYNKIIYICRINTFRPIQRRESAIASPIPVAPPVTNAVLQFMSMNLIYEHVFILHRNVEKIKQMWVKDVVAMLGKNISLI